MGVRATYTSMQNLERKLFRNNAKGFQRMLRLKGVKGRIKIVTADKVEKVYSDLELSEDELGDFREAYTGESSLPVVNPTREYPETLMFLPDTSGSGGLGFFEVESSLVPDISEIFTDIELETGVHIEVVDDRYPVHAGEHVTLIVDKLLMGNSDPRVDVYKYAVFMTEG